MLQSNDLKEWLQRDLGRVEKILLVLCTVSTPLSVSEIKDAATTAGFSALKKWNVSQLLASSKGKAIRIPSGWELSNAGKVHLRDLGVTAVSASAAQVALDLRLHLAKIKNESTKSFVEEAIKCHELGLYRSAIVMSWLGAMSVLHEYVHANHLTEFNTEARRVMGANWKDAKTTDDLGKMKEGDFLDRIENLSVIGKNAKAQLKNALDLRNGCGHPNSLQVGSNKSAAHIETLLQNVFEKFSS